DIIASRGTDHRARRAAVEQHGRQVIGRPWECLATDYLPLRAIRHQELQAVVPHGQRTRIDQRCRAVAGNRRKDHIVYRASEIQIDHLDRLTTRVADVERLAIATHRHLVRHLAYRNWIEEALLLHIEDFNPVVARVGDVYLAPRL